MRIVCGLVMLAALMPLSSGVKAAEVVYSGGRINIVGEIQEGDLEKLEIALATASSRQTGISVSSPGGSVVEAMKIGRFLRDSLISITVNENAECVSACFLIVVGATRRYLRAPVGIHRAYYSKDYYSSLSPVEAEREYRSLDRFVREYLAEMYVPEDVVAQMMATKSTTETYLSPDEFRSRIGTDSPAFEEWLIAKCGELTKQDFFELLAIGNRLQREENLTEVNQLAPTGNIDDETAEKQAELREIFEMFRMDETDMSMAAYADTLTEEYRDQLTKKRYDYAICSSTAEWSHIDEVICALKMKHKIDLGYQCQKTANGNF